MRDTALHPWRLQEGSRGHGHGYSCSLWGQGWGRKNIPPDGLNWCCEVRNEVRVLRKTGLKEEEEGGKQE